MSRFEFKLPDLGEGTIDAEIVEWHVKVGDHVVEDAVIVDVMTEKANIEVPAPVTGTVLATTGEPGDLVPVGSVLIVFETDAATKPAAQPATQPVVAPSATPARALPVEPPPVRVSASDGDVLTSPSIRRRAREAGIDLAQITGSGADGRITQADFELHVSSPRPAATKSAPRAASRPGDRDVDEIKVIGVRRLIAQRLSESKRNIPHFAYVEEIDITQLDAPWDSASLIYFNSTFQFNFAFLSLIAVKANTPGPLASESGGTSK